MQHTHINQLLAHVELSEVVSSIGRNLKLRKSPKTVPKLALVEDKKYRKKIFHIHT